MECPWHIYGILNVLFRVNKNGPLSDLFPTVVGPNAEETGSALMIYRDSLKQPSLELNSYDWCLLHVYTPIVYFGVSVPAIFYMASRIRSDFSNIKHEFIYKYT